MSKRKQSNPQKSAPMKQSKILPSRPPLDDGEYIKLNHFIENKKNFRLLRSKSTYMLKLKEDYFDYEEVLIEIIQQCIKNAVEEAKEAGYEPWGMGLVLNSVNLTDPVCLSWRKIGEIEAENLVARFSKISQSATSASLLGEPFELAITCLCDHIGGCRPDVNVEGGQDINGLLTNSTDDGYCLFRAAAMAFIQASEPSKHAKENAIKVALGGSKKSTKECTKIEQRYFKSLFLGCKDIKWGQKSFPVQQYAPLIENFYNENYPELKPFRLIILQTRSIEDQWIYPTINHVYPELPKTNLVLYFNKNHFNTVWDAKVFLSCTNMCWECRKQIDRMSTHTIKCPYKCRFCGHQHDVVPCKTDLNNQPYCQLCNTTFPNSNCFELHKKQMCKLYVTCNDCSARYPSSKIHSCGEPYCLTCHVFHNPKRGCYLSPIKTPTKSPKVKIVVFDFETTQCDKIGEDFIHSVNFAACQTTCEICMDSESWSKGCKNCNAELKSWSSLDGIQNPAKEFLFYLLKNCKPKTTTVAISHYGGRFDITLLMASIYADNSARQMKLIANGNKVFRLSLNGGGDFGTVIFSDSYNLIPSSLANLPKALGLSDNIADKSFFPHLANNPSNYSKVLDRLPTRDQYLAEGMLPEKRKHFEEWYIAHEFDRFDLKAELEFYGKNDVLLLTHALVEYRASIRRETGNQFECILSSCTTLASSTLRDLRMNHLDPETIAIIPNDSYSRHDNQSRIAIKYLNWWSKINAKKVIHRDNNISGEKRIKVSIDGELHSFKVDGFVEEDQLILEVYGCWFHGCEKCFPERNETLPTGKTPQKLFDNTVKRENALKLAGFKIESIWECKIEKLIRKNSQMKEFFNDQFDTSPIRFEEGFSGGRTCVYKMYSKAEKSKKIKYVDVQSLYPSILYYSGKF